MIKLSVNQQPYELDIEPDTPLLWVIREQVGLTGTKFGCGIGQCGACTVHMNGVAIRSCSFPVVAVQGQEITTIEALGPHPLQDAWVAAEVPQCGYCQSGQLMMAAALLANNPRPSRADVEAWQTNYCRCATYDRIRSAILAAAQELPEPPPEEVAVPEGEANDAEGADAGGADAGAPGGSAGGAAVRAPGTEGGAP